MNPQTPSLILVAALIACATADAQQPTERPGRTAFEVATIRPTGPASGQKGVRPDAGGRVTIVGLTVRELVQAAYGRDTLLMPHQVVGGPAWIDREANWSSLRWPPGAMALHSSPPCASNSGCGWIPGRAR